MATGGGNDMQIVKFMTDCSPLLSSIYLIWRGQLLAVGSEGDKAGGQVDQTADL